MMAPLILVAFVLLACTLGDRLLDRAAWVQRAPRWGIWAWQSLTAAVVAALLLVALALAVPFLPIKGELARLMSTTPVDLATHYDTPAGAGLAGLALALACLLLVRIAAAAAANMRRAVRLRRDQRAVLSMVGTEHPEGFVTLDHSKPMVYCLPGRHRRVVVTTAALRLLDPEMLRLVLAHERTHLRARHDLALAVSDALARTFHGVRLFTDAHAHISVLAEMHADDSAKAGTDRAQLARALVTLGVGAAPTGSLAAGEAAALVRVRRLVKPTAPPLPMRQGALVAMTSGLVLFAPVALALLPALEATVRNCLPVA